MRDRTNEFNEAVSKKGSPIPASSDELDLKLTLLESETARFVIDYLIQVEEIHNMFSKIDLMIKNAEDLLSSLMSFSDKDEKIHDCYENIRKSFVKVGEKINDLEKSFDVTKFFGSDTELRICSTQLLTLKKKLTGSVSNYYKIHQQFKEVCKTRVKRLARICGADISKIDFDDVIENKTALFMQAIFPDINVGHYYYNEIWKRHESLLQLENSILKLRDIMFDMNVVMAADAVLINRIDRHAKVVEENVTEGPSQTRRVKKHQRRKNLIKYVCASCCIGIIAIIVLLLILILS